MNDVAHLLAPDRLVDLTQPLGPGTVLWPGSTAFAAPPFLTYERDGAYARDLVLPEHTGTHLDAPAHFDPAGRRVHEVPLAELVRPAAVLDVRPWVAGDPDAAVPGAAIEELEARDGTLARGCAVLVFTGWDAHVDDPERYLGRGGSPLFPGLSGEAAELLVRRGVVGIGIDTLSTDRGASSDLPVHRTTLPAGLWQVEGLVGLGRLPERGAWVVVAPLLLVDGSGTPARVFAVLPSDDGA